MITSKVTKSFHPRMGTPDTRSNSVSLHILTSKVLRMLSMFDNYKAEDVIIKSKDKKFMSDVLSMFDDYTALDKKKKEKKQVEITNFIFEQNGRNL